MGRCDKAEHRQEIVETLRRLTGHEFNLTLVAAAPLAKPAAPTTQAPTKSRMQRMREIEANPLVQACKEVFDAEVIKVDIPR